MIIKNARLRKKEGLWNIYIDNGEIVDITDDLNETNNQQQVLDVDGNLVIPPFIDPHTHLDYALTAGNPRWNISGTLTEGINISMKRIENLSKKELKERMNKALKWLIANGVQYVRTHINISDPQLIALQVMMEIREELSDSINIQVVAFPQDGIYTDSRMLIYLEEALKEGADVVGGAPHFEFTREDSVKSVKKVFELSQKYNCMIDIHCDETDDDHSRSLEVIASEAYHLEMGHLVTASHTTALASYNNSYANKLFGLLKKSKINFIANPLVNTNLQGRYDSHPVRRGITRVGELMDAGLNVCFGHDDLLDPIYPLGTGNMLQVLFMGVHVGHLTGYEQMSNSLDLITQNSAVTLQVESEYGIKVGNPANLIVLQAKNDYEALRRQSSILYSIRKGRLIASTQPAQSIVNLDGKQETVNFKF